MPGYDIEYFRKEYEELTKYNSKIPPLTNSIITESYIKYYAMLELIYNLTNTNK